MGTGENGGSGPRERPRHSAEWLDGFRYGFYRGYAAGATCGGSEELLPPDVHILDVLWKWVNNPAVYGAAVRSVIGDALPAEEGGAAAGENGGPGR